MKRSDAVAMFEAAVAAVDPAPLVSGYINEHLAGFAGPVVVLALGKAAPGMVWGAGSVFGDSMTGVAVVSGNADLPVGVTAITGGHPVPTPASVHAGRELLAAAAAAPADALVLCLLSGGASSLAEVPRDGLSLEDVAKVTGLLLKAGTPIAETNAVRRAMSDIKGGRLAARVNSARLVTLALSDVGPAASAAIGSGPTLAKSEPPSVPLDILAAYGILSEIPDRIVETIARPRSVVERNQIFEVIGDGMTAGRAAVVHAKQLGFSARVSEHGLRGEAAAEVGRVLDDAAQDPAEISVYVGETTVTVTGSGRGGRNHEAALAAALALRGQARTFLAGGTDGVDGFAGGAGAVVDGDTLGEALALGLDPAEFLANNDSGGFFDVVSGRIDSGPTGTNVADIWIVGSHRR